MLQTARHSRLVKEGPPTGTEIVPEEGIALFPWEGVPSGILTVTVGKDFQSLGDGSAAALGYEVPRASVTDKIYEVWMPQASPVNSEVYTNYVTWVGSTASGPVQGLLPRTLPLRYVAKLREFVSGRPGAEKPTWDAYVKAEKLLRAIECLDRPAIVVDEDGFLSLDLRTVPQKQVFIELGPNGKLDAAVYDETTGRLQTVLFRNLWELLALLIIS